MYCKNCGRQLKEGMRFCDRCGQSVRKNKQTEQVTKRQEIEELKAERLNRKKRLEEKEAKQAINKQRKKHRNKGGNTAVFVIVIALIAVVAFILGYKFIGSGDSGSEVGSGNQLTQNNKSTSNPSTSAEPSKSKNGYATISIGNLICSYPADFRSNPTSNYEKLNLTDPLGGATMIVSQDGKTDEPKNLMRDYLNEVGGSVADGDSHAGSDWYTITINSGDKVYHRKCIVRNGIAVYYDFIYNQGSSSESKYKEYIDYIDSNFK